MHNSYRSPRAIEKGMKTCWTQLLMTLLRGRFFFFFKKKKNDIYIYIPLCFYFVRVSFKMLFDFSFRSVGDDIFYSCRLLHVGPFCRIEMHRAAPTVEISIQVALEAVLTFEWRGPFERSAFYFLDWLFVTKWNIKNAYTIYKEPSVNITRSYRLTLCRVTNAAIKWKRESACEDGRDSRVTGITHTHYLICHLARLERKKARYRNVLCSAARRFNF